MLHRTIILLVLIIITAGATRALQQPTVIPGPLDTTELQPLPPLQDVLHPAGSAPSPYGIYAWATYLDGSNPWDDEITGVGWRTMRVSRYLNDEQMTTMTAMAAGGIDFLYTVIGNTRDHLVTDAAGDPVLDSLGDSLFTYATDSAWVTAYITHLDSNLRRYGPEGSFFTDNPALPYTPIMNWEIWNEPNLGYLYYTNRSWQTATAQDKAELYAELLIASYRHIRSNSLWDSVTVAGFSTAGLDKERIDWYRLVFNADPAVAHSYDVISCHPYVKNGPPETDYIANQWRRYSIAAGVDSFRNIAARHGAEQKPVWFTEVGWPITTAEGGYAAQDSVTGVTQRLQAAYVTRLYAYALRMGVERVDIMYLVDSDGFNGGFFNKDDKGRSKRESAVAVETMTGLMPAPRLLDVLADGPNLHVYEFDGDETSDSDEPVTMAWRMTGSAATGIASEAGEMYIITDMLGDTVTVTADADVMEIEVGPCPVYVRKLPTTGVYLHADNNPAVSDRPMLMYTLDGAAVQPENAGPGMYLHMTAAGIAKTIIIK